MCSQHTIEKSLKEWESRREVFKNPEYIEDWKKIKVKLFERNWEDGLVNCPLLLAGQHNGRSSKLAICDKPPEGCTYYLEQLVSNDS